MNYLKLYKKESAKLYEIKCVIEKIKEKCCGMAKHHVTELYQDIIKEKNGMVYEFFAVTVRALYGDDAGIHITVILTTCAKLEKYKREKLAAVKKEYKVDHCMPWSNFKIPLWIELKYELSIKEVLRDDFLLDIV